MINSFSVKVIEHDTWINTKDGELYPSSVESTIPKQDIIDREEGWAWCIDGYDRSTLEWRGVYSTYDEAHNDLIEDTLILVDYSTFYKGSLLYHGCTGDSDFDPRQLRFPAWFSELSTAREWASGNRTLRYMLTRNVELVDFAFARIIFEFLAESTDDYDLAKFLKDYEFDGWVTENEVMICNSDAVSFVEVVKPDLWIPS